MDHDRDMILIIKRRCTAPEGGVVEVPFWRGELPSNLLAFIRGTGHDRRQSRKMECFLRNPECRRCQKPSRTAKPCKRRCERGAVGNREVKWFASLITHHWGRRGEATRDSFPPQGDQCGERGTATAPRGGSAHSPGGRREGSCRRAAYRGPWRRVSQLLPSAVPSERATRLTDLRGDGARGAKSFISGAAIFVSEINFRACG